MTNNRNNIYRGINLFTKYNINQIIDMIYGYKQNDLYIGDYIIINNIKFKFSYFNEFKYACLFPDDVLIRSKMYFENVPITTYENSYLYRIILLEEYKQYSPIKSLVLPNKNFIKYNPLININNQNKITVSKQKYWLSDKSKNTRFNIINTLGDIRVSRATTNNGVRPLFLI